MNDFISTYGFLIVSMLLNAMLALSLYLPLMAGQLSLATPGFWAIGGYVAAILSTRRFLPAPDTQFSEPFQSIAIWLGTVFPAVPQGGVFPLHLLFIEMAIGGLICGVLAILVGIPALRLRGIYLALATIAFVEIVRVFSLNLPIAGGATGIFGIPQPFRDKFDYVILALPMLLFIAWLVFRLERVRVGRAFISLREDELAASAMGINPTLFKVLAFAMGAVIAGAVGALNAHALNTWNARQGTFDASILILAYVIIGGSRSWLGPIIGAFLLTALPEVLRAAASQPGLPEFLASFLRDGRLIIFGLLIALSTLFFPQGIITPDLFKRGAKGKTTS
jgi:branched-chain amino acid transport system permease protein